VWLTSILLPNTLMILDMISFHELGLFRKKQMESWMEYYPPYSVDGSWKHIKCIKV
jgi:hypothetical protein